MPDKEVRFTPTRVGTITTSSGWTSPPSVHPHARGDNARRAVTR